MLRKRQRVEFGALLNFPEFNVLSLSPELFMRKRDTLLELKPMKGTAARGNSCEEDIAIIRDMKQDSKTMSENIMIVDLLRNDLGRIAKSGSITVKNLFEVQTYETLHQMISTIQGSVAPDITLADILPHLFPCGSITGAPKIRTMQIIEDLEVERRGIYTGAIGYITPANDFCFSVPIRTCIAYRDGTAEMGVGSGIVYESDRKSEFEECLLKARFLTGLNDTFKLLESMYYCGNTGTIPKLAEHLLRLATTTKALHFLVDPEAMTGAISSAVLGLQGDHKVRVALAQDGSYNIQTTFLEALRESAKLPYVEVSHIPVDSRSVWLRHKTTERRAYDSEYEKYAVHGAYDVLFINELAQITEASRHNLFIEKCGCLFTSPVTAGLLPGIERKILMAQESKRCVEKPLTPNDLLSADRLLLTNAVRGVVEVELSEQAHLLLMNLA
jgi:para-aminobenzoate synthetase/4-amino-4-deoxychorismate lyase